MAFATSARRIGIALLVIAVSAFLVWFGNGLDPWWPLLWFAPLPVLLFALHSTWRSAAVVAFLAWLLGCLNLWHYLRLVGVPAAAWFSIFGTVAVIFAAAVLAFRALMHRGAPWSALVVLPAIWVSLEYLRNLTTPHGTAGSLAYSQLHFLAFLQLASITGPWGMSFLLLLFPAALAIGLYLRRSQPQQALSIVAASLGIIVLILVFGVVRLAIPQSQKVKVGLIASDTPANVNVAAPGATSRRLFADYAREAEGLAARGAQFIIVPEKLATVTDTDAGETDDIFQPLADKTGSTIVVGLVHKSGLHEYNQARIYTPQAPVASYDKHHMLPPFESNLTPGTSLTLLPQPQGTRGVAICKDMDFTPLSRRYGNAGAGLMLVPAWDFNIDRAWHGHIAVMRGVEDGFSVARAAKDGYLTVSDDRGRIAAETRSDSAPFATLLADVPAAHDSTLYLLLGNWFAWLSLAICAFTLVRLASLRRSVDLPAMDASISPAA
ncbi:MAG TPA: nitrilase-related carbon-nitrogen hydrolase [Acidobacteriaceae bacterium]|nr:nitrilase-related carbon-nitrogen hydrolase [Acidobacteriaceae bacterium]